jgi:hypothetical protein
LKRVPAIPFARRAMPTESVTAVRKPRMGIQVWPGTSGKGSPSFVTTAPAINIPTK